MLQIATSDANSSLAFRVLLGQVSYELDLPDFLFASTQLHGFGTLKQNRICLLSSPIQTNDFESHQIRSAQPSSRRTRRTYGPTADTHCR
jgi:hypothetical protein